MGSGNLDAVGGQDDAQFVCIELGVRREPVADLDDKARGGQEAVGLVEESVLPAIKCFIKRGRCVEVVGDEVQRNSGFVILRIEKVFVESGIAPCTGQRHAAMNSVYWADCTDAFNIEVVAFGVVLENCSVLGFDFVQHFPIGKGVVITGLVAFAVFVGKAAFGVPTDQASVVIA